MINRYHKRSIVLMLTLCILLWITGQGQNRCCFVSHPMPGQCDEVIVGSKELMNNMISCTAPKIKADEKYRGAIPVTVIVTPMGEVSCAVAMRVNSESLIVAVEDAVKKWKFKPFRIKGRPVAVTSITAVAITGKSNKQCAHPDKD